MKRRFKSDVIKAKKVTFADSEAVILPNVERVALSKKYQTARNPRSDMPKTSEYAFFKKLKKDISHSNSDLLHKASNLSKSTNSSNCIRDTTSTYNLLKCPNKDPEIPIQVEKEYQTNEHQSFSPVEGGIENAGICKNATLKSFPLQAAVTPADSNLRLSPLAGPSRNSGYLRSGAEDEVAALFSEKTPKALSYKGSQSSGNGIFAAKRQSLRHRANSLFPGFEKLNSERFDLVSALLSRLFPERQEEEDFCESQFKKGKNDASTSSLVYAEPDHAKTRPRSRYREDVMVPEYGMSGSDGCRDNFCGTSVKRVLVERDDFTSAFHLIDYDAESGFQNEDEYLNQISNKKITSSLWDQNDSLPSLYFDRDGFSDHPVRDRRNRSIVPVNREAETLFLDWDFNEEKNDPLAITTLGATSCDVDYQLSTQKMLDELASCSSSFSINSAYFDALPYIRSTSFQQKFFPTSFCPKDFGKILEPEEHTIARLDQLDLPLLCNSEDLTSLEDCSPDNAFEIGNIIFPEKNPFDFEGLLPVTLDTFGCRLLSTTSSPLQRGLSTYHTLRLPHREDTFTMTDEETKNSFYCLNTRETTTQSIEQSWFSELSRDSASDGPLLLDNASWVTPVEEICTDDWT